MKRTVTEGMVYTDRLVDNEYTEFGYSYSYIHQDGKIGHSSF